MDKDIRQYAQERGIRLTVVDGPNYETDAEGWEHYAYRVRLGLGRRSLTVAWRQGTGITSDPEAANVLDGLLLDAEAGDNDFEGFCEEFGYDTDSRKAHATWKTCARMRVRLPRFLGGEGEYDDALSCERL